MNFKHWMMNNAIVAYFRRKAFTPDFGKEFYAWEIGWGVVFVVGGYFFVYKRIHSDYEMNERQQKIAEWSQEVVRGWWGRNESYESPEEMRKYLRGNEKVIVNNILKTQKQLKEENKDRL